jgi:hypothetical protein
MDFPQFNISRTEFKDFRRAPLSQHAHVEVALIDRSQQGPFAQVFQLNNEYAIFADQLDKLRQEIANFRQEAFSLVGEALQIDLEKKMITLVDDNILTYRYLIVVSSPCQAGELNAFLPTLKDVLLLEAMNAKAKIAVQPSPRSPFQAQESHSKKLTPLVQEKIAPQDAPSSPNVNPKRLCQVKT